MDLGLGLNVALPAFENFARRRALAKAGIGMAFAVSIGIAAPETALAATQWMDGASQWSVGFVDDGSNSFCTLLWNSGTGRTAEFRQGLKSAVWQLSDTQWNFPDNASVKISMTGPRNVMTVETLADNKTNLNISDHASLVRAIIQNSIAGTIDLALSVGDQQEDWEIPISRIYSMHSGVTRCLHKLASRAAPQKSAEAVPGF